MIKRFWGWLREKFGGNTLPDETYIKFSQTPEDIDFEYNLVFGQEKELATLVYLVCSGGLLNDMIVIMKNSATTPETMEAFSKVVSHLHELYQNDAIDVSKIREKLLDEDIIAPSEVLHQSAGNDE